MKHLRPEHLISTLDINVKSHKPEGEVAMRPIHSSAGHPFAPGMRFVSNVINEKLKDCSHILRDSDDLISKLSSFEVLEHDIMMKVDVKDFSCPEKHLVWFQFARRQLL